MMRRSHSAKASLILRYAKRFTRDKADRPTRVEFLDGAAQDENSLDLTWTSPTSLDWERLGGGPGGSVKYDTYGRRRQVRVADPDGGEDLVKVSYTDALGNLQCDGDWVQTGSAEPARGGKTLRGYDVLGRPGEILHGTELKRRFTYDGNGCGSSS